MKMVGDLPRDLRGRVATLVVCNLTIPVVVMEGETWTPSQVVQVMRYRWRSE
jgi:hypothetical protein